MSSLHVAVVREKLAADGPESFQTMPRCWAQTTSTSRCPSFWAGEAEVLTIDNMEVTGCHHGPSGVDRAWLIELDRRGHIAGLGPI